MSVIHIPTDLSTVLIISLFFNLSMEISKGHHFVRPWRIGLQFHPWQGRVLPLNYDRMALK